MGILKKRHLLLALVQFRVVTRRPVFGQPFNSICNAKNLLSTISGTKTEQNSRCVCINVVQTSFLFSQQPKKTNYDFAFINVFFWRSAFMLTVSIRTQAWLQHIKLPEISRRRQPLLQTSRFRDCVKTDRRAAEIDVEILSFGRLGHALLRTFTVCLGNSEN